MKWCVSDVNSAISYYCGGSSDLSGVSSLRRDVEARLRHFVIWGNSLVHRGKHVAFALKYGVSGRYTGAVRFSPYQFSDTPFVLANLQGILSLPQGRFRTLART